MEPRNIGVILWTRHRIGTRFLPESLFDGDKKLYTRWIDFWSNTWIEGSINLGRGRFVSKDTPDFLDALRTTQRGNFHLQNAGRVVERIAAKEIERAVDQLYFDLVATVPDELAEQVSLGRPKLNKACLEVFGDAGLIERSDFARAGNFVPCKVGAANRKFPVHYLLGAADKPKAVYQQVNLSEERSIDATSFMFEKLLDDHRVRDKKRCAALFDSTLEKTPISGAMDQLSEYSEVIDVSDRAEAAKRAKFVAFGSAA